MPGRVNSVAVSADGKRIAAGSSLDGAGEVGVYGYEFDTSYPDNLKAINQKVVTARSAAEVAALEKYHKEGVQADRPREGPAGRHLRGRVPARRQGAGRRRGRRHRPAAQPRDRLDDQGVRRR